MTATTRVASMVGGVIGVAVTIVWILVGAVAGGDNAGWILGGFAGFGLAVLGITAGRVVDSSAGWSALLLAAAGVAGFFAVSIGWLLTGPLFLVAAVTGFVAWLHQRKSAPAVSA